MHIFITKYKTTLILRTGLKNASNSTQQFNAKAT